ncbi:Diaminopropionate ammonia-lyase [hydrothermal vent metagenome]|uniref:Diaminopropionate ammonia-lyase n=1 Tax=hydrothermal vent metagenome TaxID=652676 RepID=A0A3B0SN32_9ZZZZ
MSVPGLAERLGVGTVLVKDESERIGLPAFKMLGASWASYRSIVEHTGIDDQGWETLEEFAQRIEPHLPLTLATATDGNHGRAVARIAQLLGLGARIWVPAGTVAPRIEAIESEGATVTVVDGTYDDAVAEAAKAADASTLVISDTSWPGYEAVPQWVIDGYSTMMLEVQDQTARLGLPEPTVIAAPMGVGALGAAIIGHFAHRTPRPVVVGGEPTEAACIMAALEAGEVVTVPGPHETIMAGLSCGTASPLAMPMIVAGLSATVAFGDDWAEEAMRLLAAEGIVSGETGASAFATLLAVVDSNPDFRDALNLGPDDVALVIVTEGATDPANYRDVVGIDAREVRGR